MKARPILMHARSTKPQRIQLSRARGFNLQRASSALNGLLAVKVDRTTRFGNPFRVQRGCTHAYAVQKHTYLLGGWICLCSTPSIDQQRAYLKMLKAEKKAGWPTLRGKNLACWCPLGSPCHADVLLEIANP